MANTITVQQSINFWTALAGWRPLNIGANNEPAITAANIILTTILSPPFGWNWNRSSVSFPTVVGQQDYPTSAPTFGFLEKADYTDPSNNVKEIANTSTILGSGTETGEPAYLAAQIDDNAGNITFRVLPVPDKIYTVKVIFQKRIPALITSLSNTWAPIPDHYSQTYQWGFGSLLMAYSNDPRWQLWSQKFAGSLLSLNEGLSEEQRNNFLTSWQNVSENAATTGQRKSLGVSSRQTLA